ncbi:MAG: apolipoprotein N-acyltransferase [Bacteroidota bacterium]
MKNRSVRSPLLLSLISGILFWLAWPHYGFAPLIFIAWVPLLLAERMVSADERGKKGLRIFGLAYFAFLIWNGLTTWWIWNATPGGAVMALLTNSLLMALVFLFYHLAKRRLGEKWGWAILTCFWISFEYFHMHWDLSWTWLTLGNVFAKNYNWVQWYEYTGAFGGSLWVLTINFVIMSGLAEDATVRLGSSWKKIAFAFVLFVIPVAISIGIGAEATNMDRFSDYSGKNIVIVQPNIDPYNEKFAGDFQGQLEKMLDLAEQKIDASTEYLIFPETALQEDIWENDLEHTYSMHRLREFIKKYPRVKIIVGASSAKSYDTRERPTLTARKFVLDEGYYDAFNTAFQVDSSGNIQVYHKSILVPGVEKMPFPAVLGFLEDYAISLGGTSGSLAGQEERSVFVSPDGKMKVAPIICYESVYGEYVTEYVKNGAQLLVIITNDGWWGNSPGYHQHMMYASLRAIETRRCIARSANTGISCFINERGDILQPTSWWEPAVIKDQLVLGTGLTFYVRHGDYIARVAVFFAIVLVLLSFYKLYKR